MATKAGSENFLDQLDPFQVGGLNFLTPNFPVRSICRRQTPLHAGGAWANK
ncbi:MAG: hypothetical protein ABSA01_08840 [Anaerolineales bacterium]